MSAIRTIDLTRKFDDFLANDHISLSVERQEIKCIVGENGAGKTTLMNMLYGVLQPTNGQILLDEKPVTFHSPQDAMRHGIGMVHQHFKLVPSLTVYENILLGAELRRTWHNHATPIIDREEEIRRVNDLIQTYGFQLTPDEKVMNLSVGLCQQVEILKMLYRNVNILILDEPTSVLTPQEVDVLMDKLKALRDAGKTIIVITHKLREVMALSDSVTVIKAGRVVGDVKTADTNERQLAQMMVGRDVVLTVQNNAACPCASAPAYAVTDLCAVNESGKQVLNHVSFAVCKGEMLGIAGVEGNGQSELVKALSGLLCVSGGTVRINGKDCTNNWPDTLREKGLGIIPEDRYAQGLCRDMTIAENCIAGYCATVSHMGVFQRRKVNACRDDYLKKYDIRVAEAEGNVSQLSGGNAQKIIIAREFENHPSVIIACQPTRGVDVGSIEFIHSQLLAFRNAGNSVLLISSELSEVMSLSDRVVVMYKGEIIGEVDPRQTTAEEVGLLMAGAKPATTEVGA